MNHEWKQASLKIIGKIFRDEFFNERLRITENTTPSDIEEWDSLAHVHLLIAIETAFKIKFTADEMAQTDSINAILAVLWDRSSKSS